MKKNCLLCCHSKVVRGSLRCYAVPPAIPGKEFADFPTVKSDGYCSMFKRHYVTYLTLWLITRRRHKELAVARPKAFNICIGKKVLFVAVERELGKRYVYTLHGWVPEESYERSN